jgi:hypothetical protein
MRGSERKADKTEFLAYVYVNVNDSNLEACVARKKAAGLKALRLCVVLKMLTCKAR